MQIKINKQQEEVLKSALEDYIQNLTSRGRKYNNAVEIINTINNAGLVKLERTPRVFIRKQYMFTFEQGGWNTVWAKTLPGAKRQAIKEYKDSENLTVRLDSVHLATKKGLESAMSLFY